MRKSLSILFVLMAFVVCANMSAQQITVKASLDSTVIKIGDQTHLSFEVSQQPNQKVLMPIFSDSIMPGLELVEPVKVDTVKSPDGHLLVKHSYLVTSFEDSLLYIPPFPFVSSKGDTVWSKSLSLKVVQPFKVDTTSHQIADIKQVFDPPFNWARFFLYVFIILLLHGLVVLGIYLYRKYFKKEFVNGVRKDKLLPAFVVALTHLEQLKKEKPWQQGRNKEYHTELTDVIREYIERIYEVSTMEMTSEEILESLRGLRFEQKAAYLSLEQILHLADLVKFAKYNPAPDEHELSLMNAYLFVNQTKIEEVKPIEELKSEEIKTEE